MLPINLLVGSPLRMLRDECVFAADYFAFEVRGKTWVVFGEACTISAMSNFTRVERQTFDAQVAAQ